jgi:hypothetical protein
MSLEEEPVLRPGVDAFVEETTIKQRPPKTACSDAHQRRIMADVRTITNTSLEEIEVFHDDNYYGYRIEGAKSWVENVEVCRRRRWKMRDMGSEVILKQRTVSA